MIGGKSLLSFLGARGRRQGQKLTNSLIQPVLHPLSSLWVCDAGPVFAGVANVLLMRHPLQLDASRGEDTKHMTVAELLHGHGILVRRYSSKDVQAHPTLRVDSTRRGGEGLR